LSKGPFSTAVFQLTENLVVSGKSIGLMLGIDQVSVHDDIENSSAPFDQFCFDTSGILNRVRQTGGLRRVVSLDAVGDADRHFEFIRYQKLYLSEIRWSPENLPVDVTGRRANVEVSRDPRYLSRRFFYAARFDLAVNCSSVAVNLKVLIHWQPMSCFVRPLSPCSVRGGQAQVDDLAAVTVPRSRSSVSEVVRASCRRS